MTYVHLVPVAHESKVTAKVPDMSVLKQCCQTIHPCPECLLLGSCESPSYQYSTDTNAFEGKSPSLMLGHLKCVFSSVS